MILARKAALATAALGALTLAACNPPEKAPDAADTKTDVTVVTPPAATPAPTGTVVTTAQANPNFTTLVSALQTAGLVDTLNGAGPFTIFAPNNAAFEKVPAATRDALMQPAGKADLTKILTYHVVPGRIDSAALAQQIQAGGGSATLTTVQGGKLTARANPDGSISLTDAKGGASKVVQADVAATNGVIHAIDTVAMP